MSYYLQNLERKISKQQRTIQLNKAQLKLGKMLQALGFDKDEDLEHLIDVGGSFPDSRHDLVMETMQDSDPDWAFNKVMDVWKQMKMVKNAWDQLDKW